MSEDFVEKELEIEKTRVLSKRLMVIVKAAAILIGIYEVLFIFNFTYSIYVLISRISLKFFFL